MIVFGVVTSALEWRKMFEHGLEWVRADFHLHTHKDKEFTYSGEENSFIKEYLDKLVTEGIGIGVITNHNKFDIGEYKALRRAGKRKDVFILPGVELSVREGSGIHALIVFHPEEWIMDGENYIEQFLMEAFAGIANRENKNARCKYDIRNLINTLNSYGKDYFIIFAHVDQNNGFLFECTDGILSDIEGVSGFSERVIGLQKLRNKESLKKFYKHFGYNCACVEGSDPKSLKDIGKGDKTYIKLGNLSYDALKYALNDYVNRISKEKPCRNHGYIKSVSFEGGRLDGTTLDYSPELNTFIGIRGSGKSSALEVMRYAFDILPSYDSEYKNNLVDVTLGSGGQVTITVVDRFNKEYEIRRIVGEKANILDTEGNELGISAGTILNNILYFGQKDLSQGSSYEAELLDRLLGEQKKEPMADTSTMYDEMVDALRNILGVKSIPEELGDLEVKISNLNHSIGIFEERGVAEKLAKQTAFDLDRQKINSIGNDIEKSLNTIRSCIDDIEINSNMFDGYESKFNLNEIERAKTLLNTIIDNIDKIKKISDESEEKLSAYKALLGELDTKIDSLKGEFAEIKRQINDPQVDLDAYPRLQTDLQQTKEKIGKLSEALSGKASYEKKFKTALRKRNDLLKSQFKSYESIVKTINDSQTELRIDVAFKGRKDKFKELIRSDFRGSSIKDTKYQLIAEHFSDYASLIEDVLVDGGEECKKILTETEFAKLLEKIESQYAELLVKETPNSVEIFYHNKPLKQHSLGQRASALVLFILSQKNTDVVIIDQPEDDLDNKIIYDEVIKAIRNKKTDIQFIFATHSANIPVLGDAERIMVAELVNDSILIDQGNIDNPNTHEQIVSIMEGGQEAFDKRQKIYASWR